MDKHELPGYMEFFSFLPAYDLNVELEQLLEASRETQIHTFGWPIGPVLSRDGLRPRPFSTEAGQGIKCTIEAGKGSFDYWSLTKSGDYYILATLFEDERKPNHLFFDTRAIRTTETFLRTARLYSALGVPQDEEMECRIEYGGLRGRILTAASPMRLMLEDRKCSGDTVQRLYSQKIQDFLKLNSLQDIVFDTVKAITEMCDMWIPNKESVIDPIVENYCAGRII